MNWIQRLLGLSREERSSSPSLGYYKNIASGGTSVAGPVINDDTVLAVGAVYSCVRVLAESMAALPLHVYSKRPDGRGRERLDRHPVSVLLRRPNRYMTSYELREVMMGHLALRGNSYVAITRDAAGVPVALTPLHPDSVSILKREDGELYYRRNPSGGTGTMDYAFEDMLHVKGLSPNGLKGYSPLDVARNLFGMAIAVQDYGARLFANDARPSGVLEHPGQLDDESFQRVRESWYSAHGGDNQHSVAILEEGMSWREVGLSPEHAQFLESRKLSRSEIGGIFRVPAHLLNDLERATYTNIEVQDLGFAKHTLIPWCVRIEQAIEQKLLTEQEADTVYVEHDLKGILRGDTKSRYEAYTTLWDRGILNANEIRALESLNPKDDGDTYYIPMNYIAEGTPPPAPAAPAAPAPADDEDEDEEDNVVPIAASKRTEYRAANPAVRHSISRAHRGLIADAFRRVVRRDAERIRAALKRHVRSGETSFGDWLDEFASEYGYTRDQLAPVYHAFAESIGPAAMSEIEQEWSYNDALRAYVEAYVERLAAAHALATAEQIRALTDGLSGEEFASAIEERLIEWEESPTRWDKAAGAESTNFGNTFARTLFIGAGVVLFVSRTTGESSCPYCEELDGKVVGVEEPFLVGGADFTPEGADGPLKPSRDIYSPPYHGGCDCIIVPGG